MGKYHPHGDSSIYEALVVMTQDFKKGLPLIDGHGNFGNIEGDGAAAMRYTEAKLQKVTQDGLLAMALGQQRLQERLHFCGDFLWGYAAQQLIGANHYQENVIFPQFQAAAVGGMGDFPAVGAGIDHFMPGQIGQ